MPTDQNTILKQAQAAAWALNQIGRQDYLNLCQRFIENAYGTSSQYGSAAAAGNALNMKTDPSEADVGDLVFFAPHASNGGAGHVGINIGGGQMVSSTNKGVTVDNFLTNPYWKNLFVGIGDPPPQWQGRSDAKDLVSGATTMVAQAKATAGNAVAGAWGAAAPYAQQLLQASSSHGVPVNVLAGLLIQESGGDPRAVSRAGAQGLMQFMPGTARGLGIDPWDPAQAIDAGARYLKQMADRAGGDWSKAVGMYNAGPAGNLNNAETRNHIVKVMGFAEGIGASMGGAAGGAPGLPPPGGGGRRPENGEDDEMPTQQQRQRSGLQNVLDYIGGLSGWDQSQGPPPSLPSAGDVAGTISRASGFEGGDRTQVQGGQTTPEQVVIDVRDIQRAAADSSGQALRDLLFGLVRGLSPAGTTVANTGTRDIIPNAGLPGSNPGALGPLPLGGPVNSNPGSRENLQGGIRQGLNDAMKSALPAGAALGSAIDRAVTAGQQMVGGSPPGGGGRQPPRNDSDFARGIAGQEARDQAGPSVARTATADPNKRPAGWVDPSGYQGTDRLQVEQANSLLAQIEAAQAKLAIDPQDPDAQNSLNVATATLQRMGPTLANIEERTTKEREAERGTVLTGTSPSSKYISVLKRNPDGSYSLQQIPNPNPEATASETAAAASGYSADVAAGASRYGSDVSRANAQTAADASRYGADVGAATSLGVAGINSQTQLTTTAMTTLTQRVTTALAAAVDQQRNLLTAQIESGKLTFDQGKERWAQWYKTNVEAPLAILQQQRETEQYKLQGQQAITQRATGQAEHERGVGQLSNAAYQTAANAYSTILNQTAPAGWNQSFQGQLGDALKGTYTPNPNSTLQVNESMDDFARRHVAEMLKGISPYAASIASATGQIGDPGQAMGGQQMTDLQRQATGVVSGALANPQQMPEINTNFMPNPIDIGQFAMAGTNGSLPQLPPPQPDFSSRPGAGLGRG